jgi:hypothetical protein
VSKVMTHRGRVAALSRSRSADDPDLIAARENLKAARLEAYIEKVVDSAPPLSAEQRDRLALLLRGGDQVA